MPQRQLLEMSKAARKTALEFSDVRVAEKYLEDIKEG